MKAILAAVLLTASSLYSGELPLGFYPALPEDGQLGSDQVHKIIEQADRVILYDNEKNFDLGLGKVVNGIRHPITLTFAEMQGFLEDERHKQLIVVNFDKTLMWNKDEFIQSRAREVIHQMRSVGYKRVVITGAHSVGVHYLADTNLEEAQAEPVIGGNH